MYLGYIVRDRWVMSVYRWIVNVQERCLSQVHRTDQGRWRELRVSHSGGAPVSQNLTPGRFIRRYSGCLSVRATD